MNHAEEEALLFDDDVRDWASESPQRERSSGESMVRNVIRNASTNHVLAAAIIILCVSIAFLVYALTISHKPATEDAQTPSQIIAAVRHIVAVPEGETPQVVALSDIDTLRKQPFFSTIEPGDVFILYIQNHVALVYRPSAEKVVTMSRITAILPTGINP